jgi:hypothetical protein
VAAVDRIDPELAVGDPVPFDADRDRAGEDQVAVFVCPQEHLRLVHQYEFRFIGGGRVDGGEGSEPFHLRRPLRCLDGKPADEVATVQPVEAEHVPPVFSEQLFRVVAPGQLAAVPVDGGVAGIVDVAEGHALVGGGVEQGS